MKRIKTNGAAVAKYFELQGLLYTDVGRKVANIDALYFPVDSLTVDTAYKVCRYCFNRRRINKQYPNTNEFDKIADERAEDSRNFSFFFFCQILSAYLGLDKER